mgnify:FL=1
MGHARWGQHFGGVQLLFPELSPPMRLKIMPVPPSPKLQVDFFAALQEGWDRTQKHDGKPADRWPGVFNEGVCGAFDRLCPFAARCRFGI